MVEKINNSKGSRFSDMPIVVSGADLNWVVLCYIAIWVCAVYLVLVWIWLLSGAVRSGVYFAGIFLMIFAAAFSCPNILYCIFVVPY